MDAIEPRCEDPPQKFQENFMFPVSYKVLPYLDILTDGETSSLRSDLQMDTRYGPEDCLTQCVCGL